MGEFLACVAHIFDAGRFLCRGFLARLRIYPTITFLVRDLCCSSCSGLVTSLPIWFTEIAVRVPEGTIQELVSTLEADCGVLTSILWI
jgi:hypothetical protein